MQVICICPECDKPFPAKKSDRDRGWAVCCGKSCAAIRRERNKSNRIGNYLPAKREDSTHGHASTNS